MKTPTTTNMSTAVVPESTLVQNRQEGLALLSPLKTKVALIEIQDAESYAAADEALTQIRQAKAKWLARINPPIEHIRSGLDLLYSLRTDITEPLDTLEAEVKKQMRAYKIEEARLLKAEADARQKEIAELERKAAEKEAAEAKARTPAMVKNILKSKATLQQQLAEARAQQAPTAVKVAGSSSRNVRKWRVTNMLSLITALIADDSGELMSLIQVNDVQMNAYFKLKKPAVGEFLLGVECYEDTQIAGRG